METLEPAAAEQDLAGRDPPDLPARHLPPPLPDAVPFRPKRRGYFWSHWYGEQSLANSYWINTFLLGVVLRIVVEGVNAIHWSRYPIRWLMTQIIVATLVLALIALWQYVGLWRAAVRSGSGWSVVARIMVVLGTLGFVGVTVVNARNLKNMAKAAAEEATWNDYHVTPSPDGRAIEATGTMGVGFSDQVIDSLEQHPQIRLLRIHSRGGSVTEGDMLHDFLVAHPQIAVEADVLCASACTQAFIGGAVRLVTPETELGFHQGHSLLDNRSSLDFLQRREDKFHQQLAALGAGHDFIQLAFAKQGNEVYVPDLRVLFDNHVITGVVANGKIWSSDDWQAEQFLYRLRPDAYGHKLTDAIDRMRVAQPSAYQTWLDENLADLSAPGGTTAAKRSRHTWQALEAGAAPSVQTASPAAVRGYALGLKRALSALSPASCGRSADGVRTDLGANADAFVDGMGSGYLSLFSGSDGVRPSPSAWKTSLAEFQRQNEQAIRTTRKTSAGDAYWVERCRWHLATLDRLLQQQDGDDLALRAYLDSI